MGLRLLLAEGKTRNNRISQSKLPQNKEEILNVFNKVRDESYQDQINLYKNRRKIEVFEMADKILEGKKRKQLGESATKR